jgi:hypothetical protein
MKITMKKKKEDVAASDALEVVVAAISMALEEAASEVHDVENTTLTIKQEPQAYTPWSSKVHTLRQVPNLIRR